MNTQLREEELSSRMRLRFGLQQCRQSNFSPHPIYKCTHTFKVSFSQCGTLAFASCLGNLTSKDLGNLSLSHSLFSLSLSLSIHHFPLRTCIWDHTIPAPVRQSRPRRESHQKWNTTSDVNTHCDAPTQNMFIHSHIEPVFPHTFTHREGNREEEEHWLRFFREGRGVGDNIEIRRGVERKRERHSLKNTKRKRERDTVKMGEKSQLCRGGSGVYEWEYVVQYCH